jgi:hypothetical protein
MKSVFVRVALGVALLAPLALSAPLADLRAGFRNPPDDCRLMVRWWWFGPAVAPRDLEREMRAMKQAGIGGFEVQPVYPLTVNDPAHGLVNLPYLSDDFLKAVRFTAGMARRLGLRMDMTLGSGWPFGGPHIPPELAAGRLRVEPVAVSAGRPSLQPGEQVVGEVRGAAGSPVQFYIAGRTGMQVKRAAVGAEGNVLDHYRREAVERHLKVVGEKLIEAAGPGRIHAVFCDSLEVFHSGWTGDLLEEFERRRGYSLRSNLASLGPEDGALSPFVRHDYGLTLTELAEERFLIPFRDWCRRHHVLLRMQAYGVPPVALSSNAYVDLPEGEGAPWNAFTSSRWASSASHHYGRAVTSAETWTWAHAPAFRATPLDLKALADEQFLSGVNQLVAHGWPYSPERVGSPGWTFYATVALNDKNPWWRVMPDVSTYLQRLSFLLRQGEPVADVALYLPVHDAYARFGVGSTQDSRNEYAVSLNEQLAPLLNTPLIPSLLAAGYNFDFLDDAVLAGARTADGALLINGHRYRMVVLPGVERMPPAVLRKLRDFVRQGGTLVATRRVPRFSAGLLKRERETAEVRALSSELFEQASAIGHFFPREDETLGARLNALRRPDVTFAPAAGGVGFVHRRTASADIYFLANTSNTRRVFQASFRLSLSRAEWWDPFTGAVTPARVAGRGGAQMVAFDLEPYGSRLLIFSPEASRASSPANPPAALAPLDLSRAWEVSFEGAGRAIQMRNLQSWADIPALRHFSGRAVYQKEVHVPAGFLRRGLRVKLNFGEAIPLAVKPDKSARAWLECPVREAAEVWVNGARAGAVWHPPYEIDVTALVRAGANQLRLVVANTLINKMAGAPAPSYKALEARYGERFSPENLSGLVPLPSGLLGRLRLVAVP